MEIFNKKMVSHMTPLHFISIQFLPLSLPVVVAFIATIRQTKNENFINLWHFVVFGTYVTKQQTIYQKK